MKPFGYSYLLDMYDCDGCDSLEINYRFLEELVNKLGMTKMSAPVVIHGPRDQDGCELYPDKAGVSGWVPLIESGIQIHTLAPKRFITLDVYSCREFDPNTVLDFAQLMYDFASFKGHWVIRGEEYGNA